MMTTTTAALLLALVSSASAFAPSHSASPPRAATLAATAELDGLVGIDLETGKKIVSRLLLF